MKFTGTRSIMMAMAVVVGVVSTATYVSAARDRLHWLDGYVWAHSPTSSSYTPSTFYSYNRIGGSIQITKPAATTGQYNVKLATLSTFLSKSTVHVTGYTGDNNYCKPATPTLAGSVLSVRCFDATTGLPANALYSVAVTRNYTDNAFAYANQPTNPSYAPPANTSWNPQGAIQVSRSGVGFYLVKFTGLGTLANANGGHFQAVAVGTTASYCKVGGWGGSPDMSVSVLCFSGTGASADTAFNIFFVLPTTDVAYAWADQPTSASYTPSTFYSWNPTGGSISITRNGTGNYTAFWSGLVLLDGGDVQVTSYGGGNAQCKVVGWGSNSANVRCFAPGGAPVDTYYTVLLGS